MRHEPRRAAADDGDPLAGARAGRAATLPASSAASRQQSGWLAISASTYVMGNSSPGRPVRNTARYSRLSRVILREARVAHGNRPADRADQAFAHGLVSRTTVHAINHRTCSHGRAPRWTATRGGTPCSRCSPTAAGSASRTAAERLDVSQATIRRDFDQLAQQQMITRTRGGAVANGVSYDLPLRYKTRQALGGEAADRRGRGRAGLARHRGRPQRRHHQHRGGPRAGGPART